MGRGDRQHTGEPARLEASVDRSVIQADGKDLAFVTVRIADEDGLTVPDADVPIDFSIEGSGEIVATDNGDPTSFAPFPSHSRKSFSGLCLAIVRGVAGQPGVIEITAQSDSLGETTLSIETTRRE